MQRAAINKESQDVIEKGERKGEDMQDFDMEVYLQKLLAACQQAFGADLLYMGLQGSWRRGEATEHSDIDVVVVLETFGTEQMRTYRRILEQVGFEERSCGFICGRRELQNWNRLELCQLQNETQDYYGSLAPLLPVYSRDDVRVYLLFSLNAFYHELCHRYIHACPEENEAAMPFYAKTVFYMLQNLYWLRDGVYYQNRKELAAHLRGEDQQLFNIMEKTRQGEPFPLEPTFEALFIWCQGLLQRL